MLADDVRLLNSLDERLKVLLQNNDMPIILNKLFPNDIKQDDTISDSSVMPYDYGTSLCDFKIEIGFNNIVHIIFLPSDNIIYLTTIPRFIASCIDADDIIRKNFVLFLTDSD